MSFIIPVEVYEKLAEKLGKETALEVVKVFEESQKRVEELTVEETIKRKLELRDELRKELATKEDILLVKQELKGEIEVLKQEMKGEIKTVRQELETLRQEIKGEIKSLKLIIYFIGALVVIMNKDSLEFLSRVIFGVFR
ncbi:MAG: coiled-coil domain-containing protein [Sulfurihydrogenibium sp.]